MAILSYTTFIASDVDRLADFYRDLFGLEEIEASRSEKYREFLTGGSKLGIAFAGAYATLQLPPRDPASPVSSVLTFTIDDRAEIQQMTDRAVTLGAKLVKPPFTTFFGQFQSALLDPEGNAFRISAVA